MNQYSGKYAFTIKFTSCPTCKPSDYESLVLDKWKALGAHIVDHVYEPDSKGICHCHGILTLPFNFYRKRLCIKGVHFRIDELYDEEAWKRYMNKNKVLNISIVN